MFLDESPGVEVDAVVQTLLSTSSAALLAREARDVVGERMTLADLVDHEAAPHRRIAASAHTAHVFRTFVGMRRPRIGGLG